MNVVMIRSNKVDPDPRVEKEVNALLECSYVDIKIIAWDRTEKYKRRDDKLVLHNGSAEITRFGIPALWGGGMRKNFMPTIKFNISLFNWLIINRKKYDCVHACNLGTVLPALIPVLLFKKKLVYDIYDYFADTKQINNVLTQIFKWIENKVIGIADVVIICSEKRKEQIKGSNPKKLEIIHNSPSRKQMNYLKLETRKRMCMSDSKLPKLVYVGNLIEDRYIMQLLDVVSEMKSIELHIGGFGVLEEYVKDRAEKEDNIYFYGKMKYSDVLQLEDECDIMLALYDPNVPNHKYAAPNKFYEALFLGKPVIMFKNTGMDEIIINNSIGSVVDFNEESLKSGIHELINKKYLWETMGQRSKKLYNEKFSWEIMEYRIQQLYKELR